MRVSSADTLISTPGREDKSRKVKDSPFAVLAGLWAGGFLQYTLTLPGPVNDRISRRGDTVRLGTFHPLLAWEPGVGWATHPPTALFAEATT